MNRHVIDVGWTNHRPVRPDEHWTRVVLLDEPDDSTAKLTAAYVVMNRPKSVVFGAACEMVTTLKIVEVEL